MCQGDTDHIGRLGRTQQCPSLEELAAAARGRAAAAAEQPEEGGSAAAAAAADAAAAAAQQAPPPRRSRGGDGAAAAAAEWGPSGAAHLADLAQRAQRARSATAYGKAHPYATLGVPASATQREVHKAYKALATRLHPDRNPAHAKDAEAAFADVSAAHDLLSDQVAREAFDAEAAGGAAFFSDEASFAASGRQYEHNLYPANGLVTELTEGNFPRRVSGERIFLIQFYSPWCAHCQASAPLFRAAAEALAEGATGVEVDVAAVNCHKWPALCSRFDVRAYPTVKVVSGAGMVQDSAGQLNDAEALVAWARETAGEWRWLFAASDTPVLRGEAGLAGAVLASADFWLVLFLDGQECGPCRTARTNLMRLSASARSRVRTGVVDCESESPGWAEGGLCGRLGLPRPPHAPVLRAFHRGNKTAGDVGEALFNPAEVEPHVAFKLVEAVLRLSGEQEAAALTVAGVGSEWDREKGEAEEDKQEPPPPQQQQRRPQWNGPPPRALPAGGFGGGGGAAVPPQMLAR